MPLKPWYKIVIPREDEAGPTIETGVGHYTR
jgi:hypothetical protein